MEGYIKLHRQLFDSYQFSNPVTLKIWVWILLKANHKNKFVPLKIGKGTIDVKVLRGQFVFGRHKAEDELNIDGSTIYRNLKKLEGEQAIIIQSNNQYSIITVCKYDEYNPKEEITEQPTNNQRTTNEQPTNTTKNDNKDKKEELYVDFEDFWNLYGKKKGDKEASSKKWYKLKLDIQRQIMDLLPEWKKQFPDIQFQPFPQTFLNQKRWNDDITPSNNISEKEEVLEIDTRIEEQLGFRNRKPIGTR